MDAASPAGPSRKAADDDPARTRAQRCRHRLAEAYDAWLRGDGAGTWRALEDAEDIAAQEPDPRALQAEVAGARSAALLRAERIPEALDAARRCLELAEPVADAHDAPGGLPDPLRLAIAHARVTLASYDPPPAPGEQPPADALAVLDEIAVRPEPALEDARSRAITNGLLRRLTAAQPHLADREVQTEAWVQVSRARELSKNLRAQGTVVRQAIDLASTTGQWERGWDYAHLPLPGALERNEEVAVLAKAAQLAWHRGLDAQARERGRQAQQASVAVDHPWVRVYAYLGGVIAAAAGAGPLPAALEAYRRCTTPEGHGSRSHRAFEAALVALEAGMTAAEVRGFLERTIPGGWAHRGWAPYARVVLAETAGQVADPEDLAAIDDRSLDAPEQARVLLARSRLEAAGGRPVAAVLSMQRARQLLRSWPGRVADQVEARLAELAGPVATTPARRRVLDLLVEGRSNREIAEKLGSAERTVAVHVSALLRQAGVPSRTALVAREVARRAHGD